MQSGDPALNAWVLAWVSRAIVHDPAALFDGNAFHPHPHSIALAEHMFSLALFNVGFSLFSSSPWFGYNLLIFCAYFFSAVGGYLLVKELTASTAAAFWGGLFWGFLFFRVHHIGHLQILSFQWLPFAALFLIRFMRRTTPGNAALLLLFYLLQALVSWYLAVIATAILLTISLFQLRREHFRPRFLLSCLALAALCAAVIFPFTRPYLSTLKDSSLAERTAQAPDLGNCVSARDYLTPPLATLPGRLIEDNPYWIWAENTLYVGYVPLLLACCALGAAALRFRGAPPEPESEPPPWRLLFCGLALIVVGYTLAEGFVSPGLKIKLPLYYLAQAVPFLKALRAPQRFSLMIYFGVLLLSGLGLSAVLRAIAAPCWRVAAVAVLALVFLLEVFPAKTPIQPEKSHFEYSAIDRRIHAIQQARGRQLVVLHYPIHYFKQPYPVNEARYMLGSTLHWAKIVNGFSGGTPPGFMQDMETYQRLPDKAALRLLLDRGVDLIALNRYTDGQWRKAALNYFRRLDPSAIYEVSPNEQLIDLAPLRTALQKNPQLLEGD